MSWYLEALSMPVKIDAQHHPLTAIVTFVAVCIVLRFAISAARRRDQRRMTRPRNDADWRSGR